MTYLDNASMVFVDTAVVAECSVAAVVEDRQAAEAVEREDLAPLALAVRCSTKDRG